MTRSLRRFEPIEHAVGTDSSIAITLLDANGDPLGVAGASAKWKLYLAVPRRRRKPFTGSPRLEKSSPTGITLATGLATVTILNTDLDGKFREHWHVLQLTDAAGLVTHMGGGPIHLRAQI